MKALSNAILLSLSMPIAAADRPSQVTTPSGNAAASKMVDAFFAAMRSGRTAEAINGLFASSPLAANKEAERKLLIGQIDNAVSVYGPISAYEVTDIDTLGSMYEKRIVLVQHQKLITRWVMIFVKIPGGWALGNIQFDDQVQTWK